MHQIEFSAKETYHDSKIGITVPIEVRCGANKVRFDAKLDTGAEYCLFEHAYGEILGIQIESGQKVTLSTVNSLVVAYGHDVDLSVMGLDFQLMAYFYERPEIRRSVLGRQGWLHQTKLALVEYEQLIYLSRYDN